MATAFDIPQLTSAAPLPSGSMTQRVAGAEVPLVGGSAPSTRRSSTGRRQTYVARSADRLLVRAATVCLGVGGLLLSFGVTSLFL